MGDVSHGIARGSLTPASPGSGAGADVGGADFGGGQGQIQGVEGNGGAE